MWVLLITFFLIPFSEAAKTPDVCDLIDLPNCSGVSKQARRTSNFSLPSPATAANLNPANISTDRGFGGEFLLQANNPVSFNLVGGSGKFGGALISPTLENSFFGVRVPELPENFLDRSQDKKRFDNKKLSLALGGKLLREKNYGLDFGLLFKRHSEVKKIRTGVGLSGRLFFLNFGTSYYKDDFWVDYEHTKMDGAGGLTYAQLLGKKSYQESYQVRTYSVGLKVKNFSFDYGKIMTDKYQYNLNKMDITILTASMAWQNWVFNYGARREDSPTPKFQDNVLKYPRIKKATYAGIQYSWWRPLVVGVHYNYFLLNEVSLTMTFFIR